MDFRERMPAPVKAPDGASGPNAENDSGQEQSITFPEKPLAVEEIEKMGKNECLALIKKRHQLASEILFTERGMKGTVWDAENLVKFALMRLEGVGTPFIAAFFSQELSHWRRREVLVNESTIRATTSYCFSQALKERMALNGARPGWSIPSNAENDSLIAALEHATGLKRNRLFVGRDANLIKHSKPRHGGMIATAQILRAFLMRVQGSSYEDIFETLNLPYSQKSRDNVSSQIAKLFSPEARAFLPLNKPRKDGAGTGNRTPI